MKKSNLFIIAVFILFSTSEILSQWSGSSTSSGDIYRFGQVGIMNSNPQDDFEIGTQISFHRSGNQVIGFNYRPAGNFDPAPSLFGAAVRFNPNNGQLSLGVTSSRTTVSPTRAIIVTNDAAVGIRTANPDEALTVRGTIHAQEVRVDLNIPADYVFQKYFTGNSQLKPEYNMPSLEEVEAFTKKNNHLPGIPSAEVIQTDGLHLKEMTNLLLEKIEELTLYTIEQEKRIKSLEVLLKQ